jgi:hypothetical protein
MPDQPSQRFGLERRKDFHPVNCGLHDQLVKHMEDFMEAVRKEFKEDRDAVREEFKEVRKDMDKAILAITKAVTDVSTTQRVSAKFGLIGLGVAQGIVGIVVGYYVHQQSLTSADVSTLKGESISQEQRIASNTTWRARTEQWQSGVDKTLAELVTLCPRPVPPHVR